LGLPGTERIFDDSNVARILRGDQFIEAIPMRLRQALLDKHITRLMKSDNGGPTFETIDALGDVIKLAARGATFDLETEFGLSADRVAALDRVTQLAIAAGLDALRDAGIPLVMRYKTTTKGTQLPDRWGLPDCMRDDTGVIFASAFPGYDSFADEASRYYTDHARREQLAGLEDLRARAAQGEAKSMVVQEIDRKIQELRAKIKSDPYIFDRRFLFRTLSMGHSQFAEFIGARGPNTQINSACASTTQAVALAEDWIKLGRCRRVVVISADDVTSDHLLEWFGAGFLASGAAATDEVVEDAAIPFDRRRHGLIVGMGAAALVIESADAVRERGIRPICEVLSSVTLNSAFHGSRLDVQHISEAMETLMTQAEQRTGIERHRIAPQTVFVSHETYTPARGGSASAEIHALRHVFGNAADEIVIANTKGFTGHAMGTGIEDVVAVKALETGYVPPVANFKEVDPELGVLNLSKGGLYPIEYALRLGAGFGSQVSLTLMRWVPSKDGSRANLNALGYSSRIVDEKSWNAWLRRMHPGASPDLEVVRRTLRIRDQAAPAQVVAEPRKSAAEPSQKTSTPVLVPEKTQVTPRPVEPAAAAVPVPQSVRPAIAVNDASVQQRILTLVAEKTGYPIDMLDLDLDMEADLGVDTVKQAEILASVRAVYGIARDDKLRLRDFPTLAHVIRFVHERRTDLAVPPAQVAPGKKNEGQVTPVAAVAVTPVAAAAVTPAVAVAVTPVAAPPAKAPAPQAMTDSVKERILALVVEKTGYPADMLDLDLDLEADLGVDTVKQAEMFAAIREIYNIPRDQNRKLRDYPTLAHVIRFVHENRPETAVAAPATQAAVAPVATQLTQAALAPQAPLAVVAPALTDDEVRRKVLQIVAQKTGYPEDMLDLDLDLEADLGIDTVKQAEMFASVRAAFDIPRDQNLKLRDFPTLAHVINFANSGRQKKADVALAKTATSDTKAGAQPKLMAPAVVKPRPSLLSLEAANGIPRRVPVPTWRPALDLCKTTPVKLGSGRRVIIMPDHGGVAQALATRLRGMDVEVLAVEDAAMDTDRLLSVLKTWLSAGPVHGIYWLPALDHEGKLCDMDITAWREALRVRVKSLYESMRVLYEQFSTAGTFLVSATRLGGQHGYDVAGAFAPMGGSVAGFTKTFKRERMDAVVKAVDFEPEMPASEIAHALVNETLRDPGAVEIGYKNGLRWTVGLQEQPAADGAPGLSLGPETVFLITGAAGSIVSAITADLASASGGTFYLLDVVPEPDPNNPDLRRFAGDKDGLKRELFARIQARGERATPALVDKELAALERADAACSAINAVRAAGGTAHYFSVNLTDATAVTNVIEQVRKRSGRIDVLLHAAGLERSHFLPDKERNEFNLVFDVKSDGWFNLLRAMGDMPLGATVAFSSVAGRFGNAGQTDYSSANDLLCKFTSSFRSTRPDTRGIVIDWTAWGGIGMATRGSIPKMMELAGIDMLPPEAGIPLIRRELTAGGTRGEVVIGKRLGVLVNEWDETGGLDPAAVQASSVKRLPGPMIGKVASAGIYGGLQIETTLDPRIQPFLRDHQIEGTPVLPGVMGIEAFAEAALCLLPDWRIEAIEDVDFLAPFKFYRNEPRTAKVVAFVHADGNSLLADCRLTASRLLPNQKEPQSTTHFTARVRLTKQPAAVLPAIIMRAPAGHAVTAEEVYRVYFHGPAYQVLERAWWDGKQLIGRMAKQLPAALHPPEQRTLVSPRVIELCLQAAGLWELAEHGRMGLPQRIDEVCLLRVPDAADSDLQAVISAAEQPGAFNAEVLDAKGNRYLTLRGYRTVELPNFVDSDRINRLRDVMSLEHAVA
jgi:3-oxoacyl-(acyl-carrier-protein) synthase/NAD(P)-dependent dehydrogenase (short-subunit alcohol dehydrogenase family)/acyl carrier protein